MFSGSLLLATACDAPFRGVQVAEERLHLYVWQREDDLSFVDPATTSLAVWFATITLDGRGMSVDARSSPVRYSPDVDVVAVFRIEAPDVADAVWLDELTAEIEGLVRPLGVAEIQLDFDATASQRDFYRRLIEGLRTTLPDHRISITALASWCFGDTWIEALPIDAAVPMYYRMGLDRSHIVHYLTERRQIPATICRDNAAWSLDEPDVPVVAAKRIFVFSPEGWNEERLSRVRQHYLASK